MKSITLLSLAIAFQGTQTPPDALHQHPNYARFVQAQQTLGSLDPHGAINGQWSSDGKRFYFEDNGSKYYDIASGEIAEGSAPNSGSQQNGRRRPSRGRQFDTVFSADGKLKAVSKDRNVYLGLAESDNLRPITSDGSVSNRIKNGVASWVYGEELEQNEAMWFSPDSRYLAYYRFDEGKVKDYYLGLSQVEIQDVLDTEAYPKAGAPNPKVKVMVYDLQTGKTVTLATDFNSGKDPDLGHYVYGLQWTPKGDELMFYRMNRHQNVQELCAANPATGQCRVILTESNPNGWVESLQASWYASSSRSFPWLDSSKFLWISEKSGFRNIYVANLNGDEPRAVTRNSFDVETVVSINANKGLVWYLAHDGDNEHLLQLHVAKLDGSDDQLLTDKSLNHQVQVSSATGWYSDVAESGTVPPSTTLHDASGTVRQTLAKGNAAAAKESAFANSSEVIYFPATDGKTMLTGLLTKPSNYTPGKRYPLLVDVYGGPESGAETIGYPFSHFGGRRQMELAELGFCVATFYNRGTWGRGRAFTQSVYGKLGQYEIDDQAAGVSYLVSKGIVDAKRVGIFGTSYGGYASLMALLRYPEVFTAASSSSPVTNWENYDSIYTERYMGLPQENGEGYRAASAKTYVANMKGYLQLYYGTADNNVHPSNSLQLIRSLNNAGKRFELSVGPDQEHSAVSYGLMLDFFVRTLKP